MRAMILTVAVLSAAWIVFVTDAGTAQAAGRHRGGFAPYGYPVVERGFYVRTYGYGGPGFGYGYGGGGWGHGYNSHEEAVRRIQATHSRSRWFTHPLSLENAPPRLDYDPRRGWLGY
ncbi:MAG: hypothetical protein ACOY3P_26730 [Planctomycetota bacterium]